MHTVVKSIPFSLSAGLLSEVHPKNMSNPWPVAPVADEETHYFVSALLPATRPREAALPAPSN